MASAGNSRRGAKASIHRRRKRSRWTSSAADFQCGMLSIRIISLFFRIDRSTVEDSATFTQVQNSLVSRFLSSHLGTSTYRGGEKWQILTRLWISFGTALAIEKHSATSISIQDSGDKYEVVKNICPDARAWCVLNLLA